MKTFLSALVLSLALISVNSNAQEEPVFLGSIIEQNNAFIPEGYWETNNDINEQTFNQIIDQIDAIYRPIFKAKGAQFVVNKRWSDGTVNASAQRLGNNAIINMYGGLARHKAVTPDGFALVVCHEIGHHLGGAPKKFGWASNEGQSDYFSTLKCLRKVWAQADNFSVVNWLFNSEHWAAQPVGLEICKQAHQQPADQALCARMASAGLSVAYLFADLRKEPNLPKFETPDQRQVGGTDGSHPGTQCRLDTYFQGAICPISHNDELSDKDANTGTCNRKANHPYGARPLCWYSERDSASEQYTDGYYY